MSTLDQSGATTIALDAMGGDYGPDVVISGAALALKEAPYLRFMFFGDENRIRPVLNRHKALQKVSQVFHTDKMVLNEDKPSAALRASKGSSMRLAIEAVKDGQAAAVVSAGNTGALMAMAKIVLKTLPGIHRPAIASVFPTLGNDTIMLDLGANVLVDAENLVQFAVLGSVFSRAHTGAARPSVGLLNVGSEESKGPDHVRGAAAMMSEIDFPGHYCGFVEGNDITSGSVDVVVSDGYAGNIALKTAEGVGKLMGHHFKSAFKAGPLSMLGGLLASFSIARAKKKMDPRRYNGGVFLGLNGLCIKSHGGADVLGFSSAVKLAAELAHHDYVGRVADDINHLMSQESVLSQGTFQD